MSLVDKKRKVFTTIGSYTSFMKENKPMKKSDVFPSINNKKDVIPFLLDTLKTVAGTDSLKGLMGEMMTKLIASGETKIKTVLIKQFTQSNSEEHLPTKFEQDGVLLKVGDIDIKGKFKESQKSEVGKLLYPTNGNSPDIDFRNSIENAGGKIPFLGLNLDCTYIENKDSFLIKPPEGTDMSIGKFFKDYVNKTDLINESETSANIMDAMYGVLKNKQNKTKEQILKELEIQKLLEQVANDNDSFLILPKDYVELLRRADELSNGVVNYDMGCGLMPALLPFNSLVDLITVVSGSTDAYVIGNAFEKTITESTGNNPTTTAENMETIKDGFFQKLIQLFLTELLQAATTQPQIRMLLAIMSSFQNKGEVLIAEAKDDMVKFKIFIKCMVKELLAMFAEYIFNMVIGYLVRLLTPVIKKILAEKMKQFAAIWKSLTVGSKIGKLLETGAKALSP